MLFESVNPNAALIVEKVIFFATLIASGYIIPACFVSIRKFVFSGLNPIAITSSMFSSVQFWISSYVLSLYRNFSSSVNWNHSSTSNLSCSHFTNDQTE